MLAFLRVEPVTLYLMWCHRFLTILPLIGCMLLAPLWSPAARAADDNISYVRASEPGILVLGDSLSAAYGIDTREGWVTLLDQHLQSHANSAYQVINASISGETTGGGLARLPALLNKYQPEIVILELGGNDGLRGFPIARLRQNLEQMIKLSQQSGARVLLLGMRIPPNYGTRYTQQFYDTYSDLAQQYDVALVPFFLDKVATKPSLMQADGIHPKAEAQALMLGNVLPVLKEML